MTEYEQKESIQQTIKTKVNIEKFQDICDQHIKTNAFLYTKNTYLGNKI